MSERPDSRRELEVALRSVLPEKTSLPSSLTDAKASVATAGVGGLFTGYLWGRFQARRAYKRKG